MNRHCTAIFLAAVLAATAFGVGPARADFVPWSYNFTPSSLSIAADIPGTGGLSLTNEPTKRADGTSDVVVTNIRAFSSAARGTPDHFTHAAYGFTLVLTDLGSSQSATLKFNGFFTGSFSATSSNIQNNYTAPLVQTVTLGGHTYTVNLGNYSPPGPPDASNAGSISAHVAVDEVPSSNGGGPPPANSPEPTTLLLSCFGLSGMGLAGWRRWRQKRLNIAAEA